jgi:DNA-binding MarR family transcriptional regulator
MAPQRGHEDGSAQARVVTLISLLRRTAHLMVEEITTRLEAAGFPDSPPSFHPIFENLDPEGTRLTTLAQRTGLTHQSVGEVVAVLEQRGYVERVPDPADGRAKLVRLTDSGRDLVRAAIATIDGIERQWSQRWRAHGLAGDLRRPLQGALADLDAATRPPA